MLDDDDKEDFSFGQFLLQLTLLLCALLMIGYPIARVAFDGWYFFEFQKICREMRKQNGQTSCELNRR